MGKRKVIVNDFDKMAGVPTDGTMDPKRPKYELDWCYTSRIKAAQAKGEYPEKDLLTVWEKYDLLWHKYYNIYAKMMDCRGKVPEDYEVWHGEFWDIFTHVFESTDLQTVYEDQDPWSFVLFARFTKYLSSYNRDLVRDACKGMKEGYFVGRVYALNGKDGGESSTTNIDKYAINQVMSAEDEFEYNSVRESFNISMDIWQKSLTKAQSKMMAMLANGETVAAVASEFRVKRTAVEDTMDYLKNRFQEILFKNTGLKYEELVEALSKGGNDSLGFQHLGLSRKDMEAKLNEENDIREENGEEKIDTSFVLD